MRCIFFSYLYSFSFTTLNFEWTRFGSGMKIYCHEESLLKKRASFLIFLPSPSFSSLMLFTMQRDFWVHNDNYWKLNDWMGTVALLMTLRKIKNKSRKFSWIEPIILILSLCRNSDIIFSAATEQKGHVLGKNYLCVNSLQDEKVFFFFLHSSTSSTNNGSEAIFFFLFWGSRTQLWLTRTAEKRLTQDKIRKVLL